MNAKASLYLHELFTEHNQKYNLRGSENKLALPKPNTEYLKRSLSYSTLSPLDRLFIYLCHRFHSSPHVFLIMLLFAPIFSDIIII